MTATDEFDPYLAWLDIKPAEHPVDHYKLLGLERFEADEDLIRQAADSRMSHVRKFQTGPRGRFTQKLLNELAAAKICLLNPSTKTTYDAVLRGTAAASPIGAPIPPPVQEWDGPEDSISPPPSADAGRIEPTPPPVEEYSNATPDTKPTQGFAHPRVRRRRTNRLGVVIGIMLLLGIAGGVVIAIVSQQTDSPDRKRAVDANNSDRGDPAAGDQPTSPPQDNDPTVIDQEANGSFQFPATLAKLEGTDLKRVNQGPEAVITNWTNKEDVLRWDFRATKTGIFKAEVVYTTEEASVGGRYLIEIGRKASKVEEVRTGNPPGSVVTDELFVVISRKGLNQIRLRAVKINGGELMKFHSLKLIPRSS